MRVCSNCKKSVLIGINSSHKHGGAWAMRGPATRKIWQPNLHKKKVTIGGKTQTLYFCTKCWRKVREQVKKVTKNKPVKVVEKSIKPEKVSQSDSV